MEALACLKQEFIYPPMVVQPIFNAILFQLLKVVGNLTPKKVYPGAFTTSKTMYLFDIFM